MAAAVTIGGCAASLPQRTDPVATPAQYTSAAGDETPWVRDTGWWTELGDTTLNRLVSDALAGNLSMQSSWARLRQAEAVAEQAGASRLPSVDVTGSASRSRSYGMTGAAATTNQFSASVGAAYEIDLWGKLATTEAAALRDVRATRLDVETLGMTLSASVAEAWYQLVDQRQQLAILKQQAAADSTYLTLVEARFASGLATAVSVLQQQQQLASTRAEIPLVEARIAVARNQLAILTGRAPGTLSLPTVNMIPTPGATPSAGVPADLLQNRPDVKAAFERLAAADYRVAAAARARYPSLRLSASTGYGATSFADLLDRWVWSLASSITAPIFDGGQRSAAVEQQRGVVDERLAGVKSTMLTALQEVEDALVQESRQREYVSRLDQQLALSRQLLSEARNSYSLGLSDYLSVLTATQTLNRSERTAATARRQLLAYRIQLYRALGGTWSARLEPAGLAGADNGGIDNVR